VENMYQVFNVYLPANTTVAHVYARSYFLIFKKFKLRSIINI